MAAAMSVTLSAPAKLTLSLRVTGVRDDGYHLIDAEMVTLRWADRLTIRPADVTSLSASGPFAAGMPLDQRNLIWRALDAVGRTATVHIDKQLPHGGGLGGGSADAAAVLRWAGCDDLAVAAQLGADVPFCLRCGVPGGRARVRGIGELVDVLPPLEQTVTLVIPPLAVSTPAVYQMWDQLGGPSGESSNDLEAAAIAVCPELAEWRDRITAACEQQPTLAGSGATWSLLGDFGGIASALPTARVVVTRS